MPTKKKNNYISYEAKKLETYIKSVQKYLDENPIDQMTDRIETFEGPRGMPIIRVIAKKEDQIKCFMERLKELPKLLLDLNELRKIVDGQKLEIATRGDIELPGFMDDQEDDNETIEQPATRKALPSSTKQQDEDHSFDDDSFWEED